MKQTTNVYTKETWIDSWGMKMNHRCATEYGELRRHIFYLMPESSFYWFRRQKFAMYSKFSVGVRFNFEKREFFSSRRNTNEYKESHVYFQGSPVCLEAGRKNVRFFAEFGYGAQGMGQMGIKYTFKNEAKE